MPPSLATNLVSMDGELLYTPAFIEAQQASALFRSLQNELDWAEEEIRIGGRMVKVPRLVCWHGDADAVYRYSGVTHSPQPWTDTLLFIKQRVEDFSGSPFNSVLGNLYRSEQDSMGWHADNEHSLGQNPIIASVSFGSTRLFKVRHRNSGETVDLGLEHGSLLIMKGSLQHHWRHCVPKSRQACNKRINLTFRLIRSSSSA